MGRQIATLILLSAFVWTLPMDAQAKKKKKNRIPDELQALVERVSVGRANFYVRNGFDTDPSEYLGRFVPADAVTLNVDDAMASRTACSEFIEHKYIGGGGVQYDEYFNASTSVSASLGIPLVSQAFDLGADVGYAGGSVVRVKYTLTGKMVATVDDPEGFAICCEEGAGRCTDLYLGEFLEGTGEIYHLAGHGTGVKAGVGVKEVEVAAEVKDGLQWSRSITFPNPVYFAFKTTVVPAEWLANFEACGIWADELPRSNRGTYYVGVSEILESERTARDQALRDARTQVVRYLGERIQTGAVEIRETEGAVGDLHSRLEQEDFIRTAADGVARHVKDRAWCVEEHPTPGGTRYAAKVLAYFPEAEQEAAIQVFIVAP